MAERKMVKDDHPLPGLVDCLIDEDSDPVGVEFVPRDRLTGRVWMDVLHSGPVSPNVDGAALLSNQLGRIRVHFN